MKKSYIIIFTGVILATVTSILLFTKVENYLYDIEMNKISKRHQIIQEKTDDFIKEKDIFIKMISEYPDVKELLLNKNLSSLELTKIFLGLD